MDKNVARTKKRELIRTIRGLPSLLIAFSGGVDSSFLLAVAHQALGDRVVAATASSIIFPSHELEEATRFTRKRGIQHVIFDPNEMDIPEFISNPPDRCYHCKKQLSNRLLQIAGERDIGHVAHGANLDDLGDYRPGIRAAEEMGIISPLLDADLTKDEIRFLSKEMGLTAWDRPATACLASRIPYGSPITTEKLRMVEESEAVLSKEGFRQCRVRHHGSVARIEVDRSDFARIIADGTREKITEMLKEIGFAHVSVDMEGYISGSMNRDLDITK